MSSIGRTSRSDKQKISDAASTDLFGLSSVHHERAVKRSVILAASIFQGRPARSPPLWSREIKQPRRQGNQHDPTLRVVSTLRKRKTLRRALGVKLNSPAEQNKCLLDGSVKGGMADHHNGRSGRSR